MTNLTVALTASVYTPERMNALVISDVHLGRPNMDNRRLIDQVVAVFERSDEMHQVNAAFIAGDWWDQLLTLNSPHVHDFVLGMTRILRACKERGVTLYVLRGTRSHDWDQNQWWVTINKSSGIEAELVYVDTLSVVHAERFGLNLLFVPDDLHYDHDVIYQQTLAVLKEAGLTHVDLAIMHGMFEHQVPAGLSLPCHNRERYEALVKHAIYVGHVHTHTELGRTYAQGSFSRTSQGEEEPKGYFHFWIDEQGRHQNVFIENREAELFITVDCMGLDAQGSIDRVRQVVQTHGTDLTLRIQSESTNPLFQSLNELYSQFPGVRFSEPKRVKPAELDKKKELAGRISERIAPPVINRENIGKLIAERIERRGGLDADIAIKLQACVEQIR